ncbi:MAG: hypothetical protein AAGC60_28010 [Acidobacteriota bacterium]
MAEIPITILADQDPTQARWLLVDFEYYRSSAEIVTVVPNLSFREPNAIHSFRVRLEGSARFVRAGSTVKHDTFQVCIYPKGGEFDSDCSPESEPAVEFGELDEDGTSFTVTFTTPGNAAWGRWVYRLFINKGDKGDVLPLAFTFSTPEEREWIDRSLGGRRATAPEVDTGLDETPTQRSEQHLLFSHAIVLQGLVQFPTIFNAGLLPSDISLQPLYWIHRADTPLELGFELDSSGFSFVSGQPFQNPCNPGSPQRPPLMVQWYGVSDPKTGCNGIPYPRGFVNSHTERSAHAQPPTGPNLANLRWNEPSPIAHGRISTFYFALREAGNPSDQTRKRPDRDILLADPMIIADLPQDPPP